MPRTRRLMKEEQIIIFNGMEEPDEADFIKTSSSAMNLLNLISSKKTKNADKVISDLEARMDEELREKLKDLSQRFEESPLKKKDVMFWMASISQYILNAYYSGSDPYITEMLKIMDSSAELIHEKPNEILSEEPLSLYDAGLGDIFTLVGKSHPDPFDALIKSGETVIKMYRNYSLAINIDLNPESKKTYSAYVNLQENAGKVFVAPLFGIISIYKNIVYTICPNRFRANVIKDFLLYIYNGSAEYVDHIQMKNGQMALSSDKNKRKNVLGASKTGGSSQKTMAMTLKISLSGISPPIWRKIIVTDDISLEDLHLIIQAAMGWQNYHLHEFEINGTRFAPPDPEDDSFGYECVDSTNIRLRDLFLLDGTKFHYTYDFGDNWDHIITLEKIEPARSDIEYPMCIKGKRNVPPEDCGGVPGYYNLLEILADPENPEHAEMKEWVGGDYDPEFFSVEECNRQIKNYDSFDQT
jgi:hypothetical protein